jgi:large conductance mechanosensitive channel protein
VIQGFKDFIMRGNVIELAVAVVIGTAFTALVTAIVNSVVNPVIALFYKPDALGNFGPTFTGIYGQKVPFPLGALLTAVISFFAVALVVYLHLFGKAINTLHGRHSHELFDSIKQVRPSSVVSHAADLVSVRFPHRGHHPILHGILLRSSA